VFKKHGSKGTWYARVSGHATMRPILDMRREAPPDRMIAEGLCAGVRHYKGAFSGEHGDGLCRGEWIGGSSDRITEALAQIKHHMDRPTCCARSASSTADGRHHADAFAPYKVMIKKPRWTGSWNVQNDPVTELTSARTTATRHRALKRWRCATTVTAASLTPAPCAPATA
jgi:hypothetical protein